MNKLDLLDKLERGAWVVPEGWEPQNIGQCKRCYDTVLWASAGVGTVLKFNRDGIEHHYTCTGARRVGVSRSNKGQHRGSNKWETR